MWIWVLSCWMRLFFRICVCCFFDIVFFFLLVCIVSWVLFFRWCVMFFGDVEEKFMIWFLRIWLVFDLLFVVLVVGILVGWLKWIVWCFRGVLLDWGVLFWRVSGWVVLMLLGRVVGLVWFYWWWDVVCCGWVSCECLILLFWGLVVFWFLNDVVLLCRWVGCIDCLW